MDIVLSWLVPGRIIYTPGTADRDLIAARNGLILEMIESEGQPPMIHTIVDHTNRYSAEDLSSQSRSLKYYTQLGQEAIREKLLSHPLLGWIISVNTPNMALKMAGTVASQQRNYRWHSTNSLNDALDFLKGRDSSLPDLSQFKTKS